MDDDRVRPGGHCRLAQVRKARRNGFTKARRDVFLETLAATCNVQMSARAAGVAGTTPYVWRRDDEVFAAGWRAALAAGYERLEAALLARALGTDCAAAEAVAAMDFGDPEAILPAAKIDTDLAIKLLNRHRATVEGRERPMRPRRHVATEEETNQALLKQLRVLRRQIEKSGAAMLIEDESCE